ncbi:MAG: hypothetical protein RIB58_14695 [Phycisphaerales bacterium]
MQNPARRPTTTATIEHGPGTRGDRPSDQPSERPSEPARERTDGRAHAGAAFGAAVRPDGEPVTPGDELPEFDAIESTDPEGRGPNLLPSPLGWRLGIIGLLIVLVLGGVLGWALGGPGLAVVAVVIIIAFALPTAQLVRLRANAHGKMGHRARKAHDAADRQATDTLAASRQDDDGGPAG